MILKGMHPSLFSFLFGSSSGFLLKEENEQEIRDTQNKAEVRRASFRSSTKT